MQPYVRIQSVAFAGAIVLFAAVVFLALIPFTNAGLDLEPGDFASRTIRAPHDISVTSDLLTGERQAEAADAVPDSLAFDPGVVVVQQSQLNSILLRIRNIVADESLTRTAKGTGLAQVEDLDLSPNSLTLLQSLPPEDLSVAETETRRALAAIFGQTLPEELVTETRQRANTLREPYPQPRDEHAGGRDRATLNRHEPAGGRNADRDGARGCLRHRRAGAGLVCQGPGNRRSGDGGDAGGTRSPR